MNCSCCYSQEQFNATRMGETGNFDQFCHERITHTICGNGIYSYRCSIPNASVGMEVVAPTAKREARAVICEIDVPESRIDERILPLLKEITQEVPADGE